MKGCGGGWGDGTENFLGWVQGELGVLGWWKEGTQILCGGGSGRGCITSLGVAYVCIIIFFILPFLVHNRSSGPTDKPSWERLAERYYFHS